MSTLVNIAPWLVDKGHWLVLMGIIIATLGAFYNAFGLYKGYKFFGGLTQSLYFGLVGGVISGVGFGFGGLFLLAVSIILSSISHPLAAIITLPFASYLSLIFAFAVTGFILGIISGFLIGFRLNRLQNPFTPSQKNSILLILSVEFVIIFILFLQIVLFSFLMSYGNYIPFITYLDIPLLGGFLIGFMFNPKEVRSVLFIRDPIIKKLVKFSCMLLVPLLFIWVLRIFLSDAFNATLEYSVIPSLLDILIGIFISVALNRQQIANKVSRRPSWFKFIFWSLVGFILGIAILQIDKGVMGYSGIAFVVYVQRIITAIGIFIGIRKGRINNLLIKPGIKVKLSSIRDKDGIQSTYDRVYISWQRFIRISLIGLIIFGLYSASWPFPGLNEDLLTFALVGGLPISIMVGGLYGLGPSVLFRVKNITDDRLGQIGVFLTVAGVILLAIPSLIY